MQHVIRTSDTGQFKRCRVAWDFGSKIRQNFEYVAGLPPLDFGTAIHAGLETYYKNKMLHGEVFSTRLNQAEAMMAYKEHMYDWKKRFLADEAEPIIESPKYKVWYDHYQMGQGMLKHYFRWSKDQDEHWNILHVEIEFEVPIPVVVPLQRKQRWVGFDTDTDGNLTYMNDPIVFQGRIDMIAQDEDGHVWIVDHKTAAQFFNPDFYDINPQAERYVWALHQQLGIDVKGVIFNDLRKKVPKPPKLLKNGGLSKNKSQDTTVEEYMDAIKQHGLNMEHYRDFLSTFKGQEYFRRVKTYRSKMQRKSVGEDIQLEAISMLSDPEIYRNATSFNCPGCMFKSPCEMKYNGGDVEWFLNHSGAYKKRS